MKVTVEQPNQSLYQFQGSMSEENGKTVLLGLKHFLPRGSLVKNTPMVVVLVVYTGS